MANRRLAPDLRNPGQANSDCRVESWRPARGIPMMRLSRQTNPLIWPDLMVSQNPVS